MPCHVVPLAQHVLNVAPFINPSLASRTKSIRTVIGLIALRALWRTW